MSELVILSGGQAEIRVSAFGGNIVRFIHKNEDVLAPRREVGERIRGGMHFCAPWFGSSQRGSKKHGFLRDTRAKNTDAKTREAQMGFRLVSREGYEWPLNCSATAKISESGIFESILRVERSAQDKTEGRAPILPGFHPYFAGRASDVRVMIGNEEFRGFDENFKVVPFRGNPVMIFLSNRTIEIELGGAFSKYEPYLVFWSDSPEEYFCLEPILQAPALFETNQGCYLDPGQELEISMAITVR